ncbi:nephrocystin-3 protein [Spatholobus suberectus]|nr:nephrocystin-3 protein [Spatholobus suberectus]
MKELMMPGIVTNGIHDEGGTNEMNGNRDSPSKETLNLVKSPRGSSSPQRGQGEGPNFGGDRVVEPSIEQLYENVCDMQSSDQSPSRQSFGSDGDESRIDSELRHLVGGRMREVEIMEEEVGRGKGQKGVQVVRYLLNWVAYPMIRSWIRWMRFRRFNLQRRVLLLRKNLSKDRIHRWDLILRPNQHPREKVLFQKLLFRERMVSL